LRRRYLSGSSWRFRTFEQVREVVVHAGDAEVRFALEGAADVVNIVLVIREELDDGRDEVVRSVERGSRV
jgi:hypothetical protein